MSAGFRQDPPIVWSNRFQKAYRRASVVVQGLAEGAIHDFVRRWRQHPGLCLKSYPRVQHLRHRADIVEIKISGGCRLLAHWDGGRLVLLQVGSHDLPTAYTSQDFFTDTITCSPAPPQFWPAEDGGVRLFARNPSTAFQAYGSELTEEWIYFLSDQQAEVVHDVVNVSEHVLEGAGTRFVFILGGPGTGKTSIILSLFKEFGPVGLAYGTYLEMPDHVTAYIERCVPGLDLSAHMLSWVWSVDAVPLGLPHADVLLVDDPPSAFAIEAYLRSMSTAGFKLVVCAFDPCQLRDALADESLQAWVRNFDVRVFALDECYRQKENIGTSVKRIIDTVALSTPFLAAHKIADYQRRHEGLTALSNNLRFPNPHGHLEVYLEFTLGDVQRELEQIRSRPLWKHWPPLLVVVDESLVLSHECRRLLELVNHEEIGLNHTDQVKGVEFQHVLLILTRERYLALETGFQGTGQSAYVQWRLLRIPFSRAKDSLVTFVNAQEESL